MDAVKIEELIRSAVAAGLEGILADRRPAVDNALKSGPARVVINSSFLLREKKWVPTNQSSRRLLLTMRSLDDFDIAISDGSSMTAQARVLRADERPPVAPLREAVNAELARLGDLIYFALLGKVKGLREAASAVKGARVKEIRLNAGGGQVELVTPDVVAVKGIAAVEWVLDQIGVLLGSALTDEERQAIGKAYTELVDGAVTEVSAPDGEAAGSVLGSIVSAIKGKADDYAGALGALDADPESAPALHEVLRLAYNFSTDVLPLIGLFVSVCDLNPLLFWCTLNRQWDLHAQFSRLPWAALGRKGDMDDYAAVIAGARSYAFHHILPFEGTLEVDLKGANVRADRVRLFPLAKSKGGGVRLQDQELADLLAKFARGAHRPVGPAFWQGNAAVIRAAANLGAAMLASLAALYAATRA